MQRVRITRISSYAQKVGVVLARRAIMIVNMIHDVTMYNASSQSNALNALDPEFLRMRISKKRSEYCKEISPALNNLTLLHAILHWQRDVRHVRNANKLMILHSIEQNPLKETITHFYFIDKEACMYNNLYY